MTPARELVVNADDFGRSRGINAGVVRAHADGIVTSASLMVRWPCAVEAARLAGARPRLGVGLHVDLGEWAFSPGGGWEAVYEVVDPSDRDAVDGEVRRQLARFRELLGRDPTHLDSHQHVHRDGPAADVVRAVGRELGVVVRGADAAVAHCGDFYGRTGRGEPAADGISRERLVSILRGVGPGVTELACHPGELGHGEPQYGRERAVELARLCDPMVRAVVEQEGIVLRSFAGLHPTR